MNNNGSKWVLWLVTGGGSQCKRVQNTKGTMGADDGCVDVTLPSSNCCNTDLEAQKLSKRGGTFSVATRAHAVRRVANQRPCMPVVVLLM